MRILLNARCSSQSRHLALQWRRNIPVRGRQAKFTVTTWSPLATAFNSPHPRQDRYLKPTGLFGVEELTSTSGFSLLKNRTLSVGVKIVDEILQSSPTPRLVGLFDKLSNTLCVAADLAEFVRMTHPDHQVRGAAEDTSRAISGYVEELNTTPGLYNVLAKRLSSEEHQMNEETRRVAELFLFDFEKSGIHLDEDKRKHFVELQEALLVIGTQFSQTATSPVYVPLSHFPMADEVAHFYPVNNDHVIIDSAFLDSNHEKLRKLVYLACLKPEKSQLQILDLLLTARHQIAQLVNYPSYSHHTLMGTMAKTPENVMDFLTLAANRLRSPAETEMQILTSLKKDTTQDPTVKYIEPWDLHYYSGLARYQSVKMNRSTTSAYFPLGACMDGLDMLFKDLYGISLQAQEPAEGELWSSDVQKLCVVHETEGLLGYIYCDFFSREEKLPQDSHFTIRGGRLLDDGSYQLPVVAIVCNFPSPGVSSPPLLTHNMVENLFHEMGHAMHSMLARTQYQHVTGTRCSTDFAEVPSVLMEYFAWDPRVLMRFARHYKTGQSLPEEFAQRLCQGRTMFGALEMQRQVLYAMIDQIYHGKHPLDGSTTDILALVQSQYTVIPHAPGTAWQQRFSHLNGYGAKYYSYLWSKAVASRIWHQCFAKDPFSREMGERYRHTMLAYGGGREPNRLVEDMLEKKLTTNDLVQSLLDDLKASNPFY